MRAELISHTEHPLGTLYYVWKQSRSNKPLPSPEEIEDLLDYENLDLSFGDNLATSKLLGYSKVFEGAQHVRDELLMILNESIPVTENIHFTFHLQGIPISLREQLVRHRIGVCLDPQVGVDIQPDPLTQEQGQLMHLQVIPDLAESTWWSQTSRVVPFDDFYDAGRYIIPESMEGKKIGGLSVVGIYKTVLCYLQATYKAMMAAGVHIEDCRQLIPLGATHNITWTLNLKALQHILGKRSCWIAQIGLWGDLIGQMVGELVKIDPMFRLLLMPVCTKNGKYVSCPVNGTNCERVAGVDGMPPCPLWIYHQTEDALQAVSDTAAGKFPGVKNATWYPPVYGEPIDDLRGWHATKPAELEMLTNNAEKYSKLWGFDVYQGVPE